MKGQPMRSQIDFRRWRQNYRPIFLGYLLIFFIPYLFQAPAWRDVFEKVVPVFALFLVTYAVAYGGRSQWVTPAAWAMNLIGFLASPLGGIWTVFNIQGVAAVAGLRPRRRAVVHGVAMMATTAFVGIVRHDMWLVWGSDIFFGTLVSVNIWPRLDLAERNEALLRAQDEIGRLATLSERERIARDLHDLLGHTLTVITVRADLGARLIGPDPQRARTELEGIAATAREALREVRLAVDGMSGRSLMHEIARAEEALRHAGVAVSVDRACGDADNEAGAVLAMVVREATTNIMRHSGATACSICLLTDADRIGVRITDNGAARTLVEGGGIMGMRARLDAAGGVLDVQPQPHGGVWVTAWMALRVQKALA